MKGQTFVNRLGNWARARGRKLRLRPRDVVLTLLPAILWPILVQSRPLIIDTHCEIRTECPVTELPWIDRWAVPLDSAKADYASFVTQNSSGIAAVVGLVAWNLFFPAAGAARLAAVGVDFVTFVQTIAWNGVATETARLTFQRPRPFVYNHPDRYAMESANYTSFYSGHTSFAAASTMCLLLILAARKASGMVLLFWGVCTALLTFSTGMFRVLAGKHFPTDVLTGAICGILAALAVAHLRRGEKSGG
ncbi:phosphatase PAP2 family protein [bacterium]|nr:phosphatase PAP2 family protein [bacterium]